MTVEQVIEALQGIEPSIQVTVDGYKVESIEGDTYYDENTGKDYSELYIRTEKTAHRNRKCPFRKITTNEGFTIDKDGNMSPLKTVEEFGPCYEKNCPYFNRFLAEDDDNNLASYCMKR